MLDELRRHQRLINWAMVVSVAFVLLRTALQDVDEIVPFGAEVGELLYDIGLAYATAWFFQWLVIVRPETARRAAANRIMAPRVYDLVRPGRQLVATLRGSTGRSGPGWPPRHADLNEMCSKVMTDRPPRQVLAPNWWTYLRYIQRRREQAQTGLESYFDRMDEALLGLVEAERQAGLMLRQFGSGLPDPANTNLDAWANDLWGWLQAVEALRAYHDRVLAPGTYTADEPY